MRNGNEASLLFSNAGNLVAIATGSDACAEHECGSKELLAALSPQSVTSDEAILSRLRKGKAVEYPSLFEQKRITNLPAGYQFIVVDGEVPEAWLGYARHPLTEYAHELRFPGDYRTNVDHDVAGAWDSRSFAVRVRGQKYVKALKAFDEALRRGDVMFAGTFLKRPKTQLAGVMLANRNFISDEDRAELSKAQREYESKLRLKARDHSQELRLQVEKILGGKSSIGYLWAAWSDEQETTVVYRLNPGYGIKAQYGGPYTREQLLDWARAGMAYELRPLGREAA